jgi:hypothetical protein
MATNGHLHNWNERNAYDLLYNVILYVVKLALEEPWVSRARIEIEIADAQVNAGSTE